VPQILSHILIVILYTQILRQILGQAIAVLWADQAIQETWARRSEFQVLR
jgi:hypothetical protein